MKSLTKVLVIFLAVVLANALHVWGQQQSLTRDNISQLTLADSISVGDFVDVDFDASGQHFVVGGNSIGVSTYDRQTEPIIEGAVLANRLKHLTLASDASLFLGTFENSSGTNFAQIFQFDSIPLEGDAPVIIFDSVPNEVLLIENNQTLLVALEDGRLATYATSTQALIQTWQAHVGSVTDVRYDSQTQTIYSVGSDNWLYGWSLNGAKIFEAQLSSGTPKSLIGSGDLAFVQSDAQSLDAVDLNSAQVVFSINLGMDALAVGFQSSTNTIVGVDANGLIRMWDADSGAFVSQSVFYELNALPLQVMVIDPLTDQVVVGGMDGKLHWLDAAGAIQHTRVPSGETSYTAIAAHNDWIAINARDDTVRVWNLQQQQWQLIDQQPSGFMAFSDDGRWLAAIGDNAIVTWDTSASFTKQVYPFDTLQFPNHIHFVQNSSLLAIAKRTEFTVVDASTGNVQGSISTGDEQNNITSITSNGNYLVAGFRDGTIRFWQLPGLTEIPNWIVQTTS